MRLAIHINNSMEMTDRLCSKEHYTTAYTPWAIMYAVVACMWRGIVDRDYDVGLAIEDSRPFSCHFTTLAKFFTDIMHIDMCQSPSSIICYLPKGGDALQLQESIGMLIYRLRSSVALAMRQTIIDSLL